MPGTVIIAAQHNTPLTDLQTANNYERPIIAGGTGAGSIAGAVTNFSLVQYSAQLLDDAQKAQARENIGSATAGTFEQKTANYTILAEDLGKTFLFTASATASFDAAADLGANFECEIWANFGVTVTLDPDASETINGAATFILQPGDKVTVWCNGTAFFAKATGDPTVGPQIQGFASGLALTTNVADATNDVDIAVGVAASDVSPYYLMQLTSALGKRIDAAWTVGGTPASPLGGLDTGGVGNNTYYIWLIQRSDTGVTDVLFSLSATAPTMPTNYDRKRLLGFVVRASAANEAPIGNLGPIKHSPRLLLNTLTSAEFDFPAGVKRGRIVWNAISTNGAIVPQVQLGTASSFVTAGYTGGASTVSNAAASVSASAGVPIAAAFAAATSTQGHVEFVLGPNNVWTITSLSGFDNVAATALAGASVPLGAPLTRGRINLSSTAFDAGYAYAMWEF